MNTILMGWNLKTEDLATADLLHCCASRRWAEQVVTMRPFADESSLYDAADRIWAQHALGRRVKHRPKKQPQRICQQQSADTEDAHA